MNVNMFTFFYQSGSMSNMFPIFYNRFIISDIPNSKFVVNLNVFSCS